MQGKQGGHGHVGASRALLNDAVYEKAFQSSCFYNWLHSFVFFSL